MTTSIRQTPTITSRDRRYERLIAMLTRHSMVDIVRLERMAISHFVAQHAVPGVGRCRAMSEAAVAFSCSYEKVRQAVYEQQKILKNQPTMNSVIKIRNEAECATIDIEGTIGLSEEWQFDNPESRVATYERFRESVAKIADLSNASIVVNIRSTGGDVNDALLIYEALRATGAHITTRCYGYTASAATIVAQAASEGCREMAPSSLYLIHNSLCSTEGNAEELQAEVDMLRQTDRRLAAIYAERSGRAVEEIEVLMSANGGRGRWLAPDEAIVEKLVDRLIPTATESTTEEDSFGVKAMRGVKALLKAIGIDSTPDVDDDINYIPHYDSLPVASGEGSLIALDDGQKSAKPTAVKAKDDPSPIDAPHDERMLAYERDARSMRRR
jgi:ATP-dependent protease ClpP protease subunit